MPELREIVTALRSKNADPFMTTCDIIVRDEADYRWLKESEVLNEQSVADAYAMPIEAVVGVYFIDNIRAVKISFMKTYRGKFIASGDLEDLDLLGTQEHMPLLRFEVPERPA